MNEQDEKKYIGILKQMGVKPDEVDNEMKKVICAKIGITLKQDEPKKSFAESIIEEQMSQDKKTKKIASSKAKKKKDFGKIAEEKAEQVQISRQKEQDIYDVGGSEILTLNDLLHSIEKDKQQSSTNQQAASSTVNTGKIRKQLKALKKTADKTPALGVKESANKRIKMENQSNYDINVKKVQKWLPQVKQAREEQQSDFTTADKTLHGGQVKLNSLNQIASNLSETRATSSLEKQIQQELQKQGISSERDLKHKEMESLQGANVDSEQLKARYEQLSKMKALLFRNEMKHKRISKIKSKLYHKIKKRDADREEKKLREYMEQVDPEAAKAYRQKEELQKVEERLRMRHGTQSKFAQNLKRFQGMDSKDTKQAFHEMVREKDALKHKARTTDAAMSDEDDVSLSSSYDEDSDESMDSDENQKRNEKKNKSLKAKAVNKIKETLDGGDSEDSEYDSEDDSDSDEGDQKVGMDFSENAKSTNKKNKKGATDDGSATGITGLKFMKRAEQKKKEGLKLQSQMLIEQIENQDNADEGSDSQNDENNNFIGSSKKFGTKSMKIKELDTNVQNMDQNDVLAAARRVTGQKQVEERKEQSKKLLTDEAQTSQKLAKKSSSSGKHASANNKQITFDVEEDLKKFNTQTSQLIKNNQSKTGNQDEQHLLKQLFVTQDEQEVLDEFEQEKNEEIEAELGEKVQAPKVVNGWNTWAGEGVNNKAIEARMARAESIKQKKIQQLKDARKDSKLKGVVINQQERDKKFAHKYWVKDVPHPFQSAKQFEAVMAMPIGKEWNTHESYNRLIQSDVITKAGTIIKPLKYKQDLPVQTIEKLVAHRKSKKEQRPAAKF